MKKTSLLLMPFLHPVKTFFTFIICIFVADAFHIFSQFDGRSNRVLCGILLIISTIIVRHGHEKKKMTEETRQESRVSQKPVRKSILWSLLVWPFKAAWNSTRHIDNFSNAVGDSVAGAFVSGMTYKPGNDRRERRRKAKKEADRRCRERWEAQNSARWHEWHAMDQAKRGHDRGAAYHSRQADYYNNKARY